jgi:hypothetical protein
MVFDHCLRLFLILRSEVSSATCRPRLHLEEFASMVSAGSLSRIRLRPADCLPPVLPAAGCLLALERWRY